MNGGTCDRALRHAMEPPPSRLVIKDWAKRARKELPLLVGAAFMPAVHAAFCSNGKQIRRYSASR